MNCRQCLASGPFLDPHNEQLLTNHLKSAHQMNHSASHLAKVMVNSLAGRRQVLDILHDVQNIKTKHEKVRRKIQEENRKLSERTQELLEKDTPEGGSAKLNELTEIINDNEINMKKDDESYALLRDELTAVKKLYAEKVQTVDEFKSSALEKELKLKSSEEEKEKLTKEKEMSRKISAQLIESQRIVHEKEIQDINQKLQNQINRSQALKFREKSLMDEIESLKAIDGKNKDTIQRLTKIGKKSGDRENELVISRLQMTVQTLETRERILKKDVLELKDYWQSQRMENSDLRDKFDKYKNVTDESIAEKLKKLQRLEAELENAKRVMKMLSHQLVDERKTYEKSITEMKNKFREMSCVMKESLSGLENMHEDVSDKLTEAIRNNANASKVRVSNVMPLFEGLEIDFGMDRKDPDLDQNMNAVKKEPDDEKTQNAALGVGRFPPQGNKKCDRVSKDLHEEFGLYFGEKQDPDFDCKDLVGNLSKFCKKRKKY